MTFSTIAILFLLIAVIVLTITLEQHRARRKQRAPWGRAWPVRKVALGEVDPLFIPQALGPKPESAATILGSAGVFGSTSDTEAWILAALAKQSKRIFEFGTCSGRTTYLMGLNAPADAEIVTITLAPEQVAEYARGSTDDALATAAALKESCFTAFYYTGTPIEKKVTQLFGDSKALDAEKYRASCDLIFIDGSHAYSYVVSDTEKALTMVKPGGLILWHDYKGPRVAAGVFKALNERAASMKLMHIAGTTLVAYRAPKN